MEKMIDMEELKRYNRLRLEELPDRIMDHMFHREDLISLDVLAEAERRGWVIHR